MTLSYGAHSPHPDGVSQPLGAGGAAWLGTPPAEKGTPSLPGEGKRGDILGQSGEGKKFQFQTALTFGLGLPNRLVLHICKGGACLRDKGCQVRDTHLGLPPGAGGQTGGEGSPPPLQAGMSVAGYCHGTQYFLCLRSQVPPKPIGDSSV